MSPFERMDQAEAAAPPPPAAMLVADARAETREAVRCPHFGPCGGCALLDLHYAKELRLKDQVLRRLVRGRGALNEAECLPVLPANEPLFYRTSLKVPFGLRGDAPIAGFFRPRTHRIVDLHVCAIQHPLLTKLLVAARNAARELATPIQPPSSEAGLLRYLVARLAPSTGETLAGLVVNEGGRAETRRLAEVLFERFRRHGLVGVVENVNRGRTPARRGGHGSLRFGTTRVLGPESSVLVGREELLDTSDGLVVRTGLGTFAQANAGMASVLYAEVLRMLAAAWGRAGPPGVSADASAAPPDFAGLRVVDLFSGHGPIALRLAQAGARVDAVERDATASLEGRRAAEASGLAERLRFVASDAGHALRALDGAGLDALVVDPPRRGLGAGLIEALRGLAAPLLIYVSCNPKTLLDDMVGLASAYRPRWIRGVDLFPRTRHLEVVALLERRIEASSTL
jgi:23S rRNA (uracil1939-C5)-methyltransferase